MLTLLRDLGIFVEGGNDRRSRHLLIVFFSLHSEYQAANVDETDWRKMGLGAEQNERSSGLHK